MGARKSKTPQSGKGKRMTIFKKLHHEEPPPEPPKPQEAVPGFVKVGESPKPAGPAPTPKVEEAPPAPKAPVSSKVHEGKTYYCAECGAVLMYGYSPFRLIHPDYNQCPYTYVEIDPPKSDVLVLSVLKK